MSQRTKYRVWCPYAGVEEKTGSYHLTSTAAEAVEEWAKERNMIQSIYLVQMRKVKPIYCRNTETGEILELELETYKETVYIARPA